MPIQITSAPSIPAVTLNRVHAVELRINITEEQAPKAPVRLVYKLYGTDTDGARRWSPEQHVITIPDAYTAAGEQAQAGQPALYNALVALVEVREVSTSGSTGPTAATIAAQVRAELTVELARLVDLAKIHGLVAGSPLTVTPTGRTAGGVEQDISEVGDVVTVSRVA